MLQIKSNSILVIPEISLFRLFIEDPGRQLLT